MPTALDEAFAAADHMVARARKAADINPATMAAQSYAGNSLIDTREQDHANRQLQFNTGWTYAAIRPIGTTLAGLPILLGRPVKGTKGFNKSRLPQHVKAMLSDDAAVEIVESHPFLEAISDPNEWMVEWSLKYITALSLQLTGKAYWWLLESKRRKGSFDIWPVPPHWVRPKHVNGIRTGWLVQPPGASAPVGVKSDRMAYFYYPSPNDPFGASSPLDAAAKSVETSEAIKTAQRSTFDNLALPAVAFIAGDEEGPTGKMTPLQLEKWQLEQLEMRIKQLYRGANKWGRFIVLDRTIKDVKPISNKPMEMDFTNSSKLSKEEIMQIFGTNPIIAGQVEGANRASATVAREGFADNVINPTGVMMGQVINQWVLPLFLRKNERLMAWIEEYKPYDPEQKLSELDLMVKNGGLLVDELRAEFGYAPLPNGKGNVIVRPLNLVVESADEETEEEVEEETVDPADGEQDEDVELDDESPLSKDDEEGGKSRSAPFFRRRRKPKPGHGGGRHGGRGGRFEETEHTRGAGGKFEDKPGDGNSRRRRGGPRPPKSDEAASVIDRWTTPARGGRTGEYEAVRSEGEKWVSGGKNEGFESLYKETQGRLKKQGIKAVKVYRGIDLPKDHPLAKAISEGKMKAGMEFETTGSVLTSWSGKSGVADHFTDSPLMRAERVSGTRKTIGIVIERRIERKDIVSSHRTHTGFLAGENEYIGKNSGKIRVRLRAVYGA